MKPGDNARRPGQGATSAAGCTKTDASPSSAITVFLADDHAVVRDGLRMLLESQPDIQVLGDASNGRDAVRLVRRLNPNVVVLDITMTELNGIEAANQIREYVPAARVVILSMHATSEHVFRAMEAGALGYVLKESAGTEVVAAVRSVHGGHRYLSQKIADMMGADGFRSGRDRSGSLVDRLSAREREVLQLVVEGKSSREIAEIIHLSPKSVETYRSRLMLKLNIHDIPGLVKFAIERGLTPVG